MNRQESLRVPGGLKPAYLPFTLSSRLVRDLRSIVFALRCTVNDRRDDRAVGGRVAAQLVGDETSRSTPLVLQQFPEETLGCPVIAPGLHEDVDHVTVLVDR